MRDNDTPESNEIPYGYCHCGCGNKTSIATMTSTEKGWIKGEPLKFFGYHANKARQRNAAPWIIDDESGCWNYTGTIGNKGYGRIVVLGKPLMAHRYFYEKLIGPIPTGLALDHLCFNPSCVNPTHLEPVTYTENNRRSRRIVLTPERQERARQLEGTLSYSAIAREIGVSTTTVWNFLKGKSWTKR